jgi:regulator of protease activity HflC (stomatin/prohibitin superfamily)
MDADFLWTIGVCAIAFFIILGFFIVITAVRVIPENKRLSVYRLGRPVGFRGPGLVFLIPGIEKGVLVDSKNAQIQNHLP